MEENTQTKVCSKCHRELPLSEFHKSSTSKDGHQSQCKECRSAQSKNYRKEHTILLDRNGMNNIPLLVNRLKNNPQFDLKEYFTPRELMAALYDLGYRGELTIIQEHKVTLKHE